MASLKKRNGTYYIRFFTRQGGKRRRKALSLGTKLKREAEKMLIDYEDKFERGEIDPFNGWTPKMEAQKKRNKLSGKHISIKKATDEFIRKRSQANQTTKDHYQRIFNMFMEKVGTTMPVTQIIENDIRNFCFKPALSNSSQANYLCHLKVFFKWLKKEGILKEDISKDLKPPKTPQKITQKTVSRKELDRIFKAFDAFYKEHIEAGSVTKPYQKRLWFKPMISTIYYCGLRAKEAVNLTWNDVKFEHSKKKKDDYGYIRIANTKKNTTKSGKERIIPIRKPLYPWLKKWHDDQGKPSDGYVFPSASGLDEWSKMDPLALSKSYKKFVKKAKEVPNTPTLHGLRHSCATDLLAKGVSPVVVQKIMGHASINTTMIYEHLDAQNIKNAVKGID